MEQIDHTKTQIVFVLRFCHTDVAAVEGCGCAVTSLSYIAGITHISYSEMLKQTLNLILSSYNNIIDVHCGTIYLFLYMGKIC